MTTWHQYDRFSRANGLKNEGRELLGHEVVLTEKRDGENVSLWMAPDGTFRISSHNLERADDNIAERMKATPEYRKVLDLLQTEHTQYGKDYVVYGELLKQVGPTRTEPKRKHTQWVLFDVWHENHFLDYTNIYQLAHAYKLPVVKALHSFIPLTLGDIQKTNEEWLKWCRRHRREGFVGKVYRTDPQIMYKEKVDIPSLKRLRPTQLDVPQLPEMPEDRILRALKHALDEVGESEWNNIRVTMPVVAKQLQVEANEHNFECPRNAFALYKSYKVETIKASV